MAIISCDVIEKTSDQLMCFDGCASPGSSAWFFPYPRRSSSPSPSFLPSEEEPQALQTPSVFGERTASTVALAFPIPTEHLHQLPGMGSDLKNRSQAEKRCSSRPLVWSQILAALLKFCCRPRYGGAAEIATVTRAATSTALLVHGRRHRGVPPPPS
jgi:hypothetical protein